MSLRSLATGAVLSALAAVSFSLPNGGVPGDGVRILGPADQGSIAHFNVYLPLTHQDALESLIRQQTDPASANYHRWLTPAEFKQQFGPAPASVEKVRAVPEAAGFTVVGEHTQSLAVEGPVWAVERTFSTHLQRVQIKQGREKLSTGGGHLTLPDTLAGAGAVIPDFTTHLMHVHSTRAARNISDAVPSYRLSSNGSFFYPNDLNEAYQLPSFRSEVDVAGKSVQIAGVGAHIGIVISSVIDPSDLKDTFNSKLNISAGDNLIQAYSANSNLPVPTVKIKTVDGGSGAFDPSSGDAAEASLDTQMSLGTAPGAKETLFNIPDLSDNSILNA